MLVYLFHADSLDRAVLTNDVDGAVSVIEANSAIPLPDALERV
jgi:hypothetical protein